MRDSVVRTLHDVADQVRDISLERLADDLVWFASVAELLRGRIARVRDD